MQFRAELSQTSNWTLDDFIATLRSNTIAEGVLLMGSTGTAAVSPTSDYDLLLVLSEHPAQLRVVTTWVDQRLTEVYCTTTSTIERIVAHPLPWLYHSDEGMVLSWLRDGRIAYDRNGQISRFQEQGRNSPPVSMPDEDEVYEAWRKIGYNVAQMNRYIAGDDPVAQVAVDLRLLYSLAEVNGHYFTVRQLPWRGEKQAVRYWTDKDPTYLALLQNYAAETDRQHKVMIYQQLAKRALAPVGGLWDAGSTVIGRGSAYGSSLEQPSGAGEMSALELWQRLVEPAENV